MVWCRIGVADLSVAAPELVSARGAFSAEISSPSGRRGVVVTLRDEHGRVVEQLDKAVRRDVVEYTTAALEPGGYRLEVRDAVDPISNNGVIPLSLVWPE